MNNLEMVSRAESLIPCETSYDLPFAIAYGKITWFLWQPLDAQHRKWTKINENLVVEQQSIGSPLKIRGSCNKNELKRQFALWYDSDEVLTNQPREILDLFNRYPLRFPWTAEEDFLILFAAGVLSPQVSWEVNTDWISTLYAIYRRNFQQIANELPSELGAKMQHTRKVRKLGYHARVLVKAFQDLNDGIGFQQLLKMKASDARKELLQIYGIGPKIAFFITQATHGDLNAPCVDRHVFNNAKKLGFISQDAIPYNSNACKKYIDDCSKCPYKKKCAVAQLARFNNSTLLSSLLYYLSFA